MENTVRAGSARLRRRIAVVAGVAAMIASVLAGAPAQAGPALVVDDDGAQCAGAAYATIGAAVDAAVDGDTIKVCPGSYAERLEVTKSIRIIGPVDATRGFDCFGNLPAQPGDLDITRFAVVDPPPPTTTEATEPLLSLAADGVEAAGLVIQGVVDQTPAFDGIYDLYTPAIATSDAHSGYRIHDNLIRSNTLGIEFGSDGETTSRVERNCLRENRFGVANQRLTLARGVIGSNSVFRSGVLGFEIGWGYRPAESVSVSGNTVREAPFGIFVQNSRSVRVADNNVASSATRAITISGGNDGTVVTGNLVEGGASLTASSVGIITAGLIAGLPPSTDVVVRDNTVSGIRFVNANGSVVGLGIAIGNASVDGAEVLDNVVTGNGLAGIGIFSNTRNVTVRDNVSDDNAVYGIRAQGTGLVGNVIQDNRMLGNGAFDASDVTDPNPVDGIQLLNTWIDNHCVTDQPAGAICAVE